MEALKSIVNSGYTNVNILDQKGRQCSYIARKEGHKELSAWIDTVSETFVSKQ